MYLLPTIYDIISHWNSKRGYYTPPVWNFAHEKFSLDSETYMHDYTMNFNKFMV